MGTPRRTRGLLLATAVIVALAAAIVGYTVWSGANQRRQTAEAFAVLNTADRHIDLRDVFPNADRSQSGVEVRTFGVGPGPAISYSFVASSDRDWKSKLKRAMDRAGYGDDGEPWIFQVRGWSVLVLSAGPAADNGGRVTVSISTH